MEHLADCQTLYRWSDDLYSYTFPLKIMGARYGRRMIVFRSEEAELLLLSPLPLPFALVDELQKLGRLSALVFPTRFHDTALAQLRPLRETLAVYAVEGMDKALPEAKPIDALPQPWSEGLQWQRIEGMPKVNETVFFHPGSRSLLTSDLLFKFDPRFPLWTRMFARMLGVYPQLRPSRLLRALVADRPAFQASLAALLDWDFERILPAHAAIIGAEEGRAALTDAARF